KGLILVFPTLADAVAAGRWVAAEHVQLMGAEAETHVEALQETAGAVFVGETTPTAFGDYLAGPSHVLLTGVAARSFSGLSALVGLSGVRLASTQGRDRRRDRPAVRGDRGRERLGRGDPRGRVGSRGWRRPAPPRLADVLALRADGGDRRGGTGRRPAPRTRL